MRIVKPNELLELNRNFYENEKSIAKIDLKDYFQIHSFTVKGLIKSICLFFISQFFWLLMATHHINMQNSKKKELKLKNTKTKN